MSVRSFGISESPITQRKTNKQTNTQNRGLSTSASREVTQKLTSAAGEQAVGRKVRVASSVLKVRTGPECPECPI